MFFLGCFFGAGEAIFAMTMFMPNEPDQSPYLDEYTN